MVRENKGLPAPEKSKGFDQDEGTNLNEELDKTGQSTYETQYPDGERYEHNVDPIAVRGDVVPDKKG